MNLQQKAFVEDLCRTAGSIRWRAENEALRWQAKRLSGMCWWLLACQTPTAAELVKQGMSVEDALAEADRQTERMNRIVGPC